MNEPISTNTPAAPPVYQRPPGVFGTKIPSAVAFGIGLLLFLLPFIDIRCNGMSLQTVSGVQLATGFEVSSGGGSGNSLFTDNAPKKSTEKKKPNLFAMVALVLAALGLILSLAGPAKSGWSGILTGGLSAAALIGLFIDVKREVGNNLKIPKTENIGTGEGDDFLGLNKLGQQMDKMSITVDFTPWFYVAVIAFLAAAFFSYKRWKSPA